MKKHMTKRLDYIDNFCSNEKLLDITHKKLRFVAMSDNLLRERQLKNLLILLYEERMTLILDYKTRFDGDL